MRLNLAPILLISFSDLSRRLLITLLFLMCIVAPAPIYAQNGTSGRDDPDTIPGNVARRALDAYNRHDVTALVAFYDTVAVHEMLGDSTGRYRGSPADMYASLPNYFAKNKVRAELKQQIVSGPLVVQLYDFIENGKRTSHIEVYEVRHGKIVHDWDQGP